MRLETINSLLRRIGLVLVVCTDDGREQTEAPTTLRIERWSTYKKRAAQNVVDITKWKKG